MVDVPTSYSYGVIDGAYHAVNSSVSPENMAECALYIAHQERQKGNREERAYWLGVARSARQAYWDQPGHSVRV